MIKKSNFIIAAEYIEKNEDDNPYDLFKVLKILKKNSEFLIEGIQITVRAAGHYEGIKVHHLHQDTGMMKSRFIDSFESKSKKELKKGLEYLIFLKPTYDPEEYELTARNGFLNIEMESRVRKLIK